ncbi:ArpU family phage packaging/lysis transcriptional regulator [Enterococcus sp. 2201sp1_2201st1_B8_2201SCRN_220225]|uniref:ArpU family phage packaging/lysis transcriptional regulator n=1 Tax=unclassified Enterococcus TaxID=2608891 RepID=UPI0034A587EF
MALFPEIDEKQTKDNVKQLLSRYRNFVRLASEEYIPKVTATYSFELKSFTGNVSRPTENAVVRKVTAEQELAKIARAMNKLNAYDAQLIYDKYMDKRELTDTDIYLNYHMSASGFYNKLEAVLIKFAEAYEGGVLIVDKPE